jgi:hypothetical protein
MSENPYQSPSMPSQSVGVKSPDGVRKVAVYQRAIMYCILANIILYVTMLGARGSGGPASMLNLLLAVLFLAVGITQLVYIVLLAVEVYNVAVGVLLGVLCFIPCVGLLILLMVNQKATKTLQQNGIKVGLMGANMSQFGP